MKSLFLSLVILASLFFMQSCREDGIDPVKEPQFLKDQKISINGLEREYHIFLPADPVNKPLVMLLHGHGGSFNQSIGDEGTKAPQKVWLSIAEQEDIILIIPNGVLGPEDTRGWNDCRNDARGNPESDDVAFLSTLLDKTQEDYNYNDKRVYITGISNGGFMSLRLVQEIPEKITAFAAIVITMPTNSQCPNSDIPVSALFMNGTDDPLAPYNGGNILSDRGAVQSTDASVDYWVSRNNTDTEPIEQQMEDINKNDKSTAVKFSYTNGTNNTEVVLYKIIGGGHTEPSLAERYGLIYKAIVGEQNGDFEMADEVWNFFKMKSK